MDGEPKGGPEMEESIADRVASLVESCRLLKDAASAHSTRWQHETDALSKQAVTHVNTLKKLQGDVSSASEKDDINQQTTDKVFFISVESPWDSHYCPLIASCSFYKSETSYSPLICAIRCHQRPVPSVYPSPCIGILCLMPYYIIPKCILWMCLQNARWHWLEQSCLDIFMKFWYESYILAVGLSFSASVQLEEELYKARTMLYDGDVATLLPAKANGEHRLFTLCGKSIHVTRWCKIGLGLHVISSLRTSVRLHRVIVIPEGTSARRLSFDLSHIALFFRFGENCYKISAGWNTVTYMLQVFFSECCLDLLMSGQHARIVDIKWKRNTMLTEYVLYTLSTHALGWWVRNYRVR